MFTAPRFVVIDDKAQHLDAILKVFQELGTPGMGIVYDPAEELNPLHFRGVRALFLDLHLLDGVATTDHNRHFAHIAQILEDNISPNGGPFVLVIWTEHAHLRVGLTQYLDERLDPERPYAKPLAVLCLAKDQFINVQTGALRPAATLRQAVEQAVTSNSQLAALIDWELDVVTAAGATLSALLALVPPEGRTTAAYPGALDVLLSRLARESVGRAHVAADPRAVITAVLAPILADRITNQESTPQTAGLWANAVTRHQDGTIGPATPHEAGQINRMLHLAVPGSETIRPTDWGAVVNFPDAWWTDNELRRLFGVSRGELLGDEFKIATADRPQCRPRLVRVGAACDHAQNRRGPLSYLFGLEIPVTIARRADPTGVVRVPASEWSSPRLLIAAAEGAFTLAVNSRYVIAIARDACQPWQSRYRLREQLHMHLISHANSYVSRPGIVQL